MQGDEKKDDGLSPLDQIRKRIRQATVTRKNETPPDNAQNQARDIYSEFYDIPLSQRSRKSRRKITERISERLIQVAVWTTQRPSRYLAGRMSNLGADILKSNLSVAPEGIIALSLFATIIGVPIVAVITYLVYTAGYALIALFIPITAVLPFVIGVNSPKISASSRASALENELPFLIGYITVLAGGGISPFKTIKRIANNAQIFPAGSKEARRILLDIELFGLDPVTAFEKAAISTPNKKFSDFLAGYIGVLKTGGDVLSYLQAQLKEVYAYSEIKMRSSAETIGTFAETYIIATVVVGLSIFIFFITEALLTSGSQGISATEIELFSAVFVPAISIAFIMVINSAQIKEPFTYYPPYYAFLAAAPVGALFFFLVPFAAPVYVHLGIALIIVTTPGAVINEIHTRRKKAVEAKVSNFVRDIAEIRKTGLAPEKTIEQLAGRNYAGLTEHVKLISNQLSWGIPIRRVMKYFSAKVKSWMTQAVAFLLLEVVDVGGGSPSMFIGLAEFTEKTNQLNKERKGQVRPYIIVPYIGAVLIVVTTALMVYLIGGSQLTGGGTSGFSVNPQVLTTTTTILFVSAFFQAWVMGIVAGKMGELTVSDGFKHGTLIVVVSLIAAYVSSFFVKF